MTQQPRTTFRTLGDVLGETVRLLDRSAAGLARLASAARFDARQQLMLQTIASARANCAEQLRTYKDASNAVVQATWLQYARVFEPENEVDSQLTGAEDENEALDLLQKLDDELSEALQALSKSYSPPIEACESAGALIEQLRRDTSTVRNGAADM